MITLTPLSVPWAPGTEGREEERPPAYAYLVELDDARILLGCGGNESFSFARPEPAPSDPRARARARARTQVSRNTSGSQQPGPGTEPGLAHKPGADGGAASTTASGSIAHQEWEGTESVLHAAQRPLDEILLELGPTIDLVLLNHSTLSHLGTLAWARSHAGLTAPVFATMATQAMGRMTCLSAVRAIRAERDVDLETRLADEMDLERGIPGAAQVLKKDESQPLPATATAAASSAPAAPAAPAASTPAASATSAPAPAPVPRTHSDPDAEEAWLHAQASAAVTAQRDPSGVELAEVRTRLAASGTRLRVPTEQQVDETFDHITALRFLQPHRFGAGPLAGSTLTAYNAGHSLGGAMWKLRSPEQGTILFALDWNHNRELHLDGAALMPHAGDASKGAELRRADILVTSIGRGRAINLKRKDRNAALLSWITEALHRGGSVILPADPSARTLELLVLLDQYWTSTWGSNRAGWGAAGAGPRPQLCFVSPTGAEMLERARTLMEWTTREWAGTDQSDNSGKPKSKHQLQKDAVTSPLDFKNVRVFPSVAAMQEELPPGMPKVVLAVHQSGFGGPALELITRFASSGDPRDLVLLTSRAEAGSPLRALWNEWEARQAPEAKWGKGQLGVPVNLGRDPSQTPNKDPVPTPNSQVPPPLGVEPPTGAFTMRVDLYQRVKLRGAELAAYEEALAATRVKAAQRRSLVARSRRRMQAEKEEEEASDSDFSGSGLSDDDDLENGLLSEGSEGGDELDTPATGAVPRSETRSGRKRRSSQAFGGSSNSAGGGSGAVSGSGSGTLRGGANQRDPERDYVSDIYLKGDAAKIVSFWSGRPGASSVGVRYRMIPSVEKRRKVDTYGELIDKSKWIRRAEELSGQPTNAREFARVERARVKEDEERKRAQAKARAKKFAPARFSAEYGVPLRLVCQVGYVDNSGLGDGKALSYLMPQLQPRRLVLVGGDTPTRHEVRDTLLAIKGMTRSIWAPPLGSQTVISTSADDGVTKSLTVNVQNSLLAHLRWSRFEDYELARLTAKWAKGTNAQNNLPSLAWIDDEVSADEPETAEQGEGDDKGELQGKDNAQAQNGEQVSAQDSEQKPGDDGKEDIKMESDGANDESPAHATSSAPQTGTDSDLAGSEPTESDSISVELGPSRVASTMLIGDLRLSALKAHLARVRVPADFAGDGLLVAGWRTNRAVSNASARAEAVTIRKAGSNDPESEAHAPQVIVEGNVGQDLVTVRDVVYGMHAQIGQ